jgi:predicted permease
VAPAIGRGFTDEDAQAGDVIVLSHGLWLARYGGDPGIVGSTLQLSGRSYEVLGVMPEGFVSPTFGWIDHQQYWVPFVPTADNRTWGRFLLVLGRLQPGTTVEAAQREMTAIATELQSIPANAEWTSDVVSLHEQMTKGVRTALVVLLIAVVLLQLIALVNVLNLVLARMQERDHEFGVRAALGAGRARLLRQLLAEAFALISIGAPLGVLAGTWVTMSLVPLLPAELPRLDAIRIDGNVLSFAAVAAGLSLLVLGLVPLARLGRRSLTIGSARSGARMATSRASSAIIVAEIALALMLTATAGLTLRSFIHLRTLDAGFTPDDVVTMRLMLPPSYDDETERALYFEQVLANLRAVPGVTSAAAGSHRPFSGGAPATRVVVQGTTPEVPPVVEVRVITPEYFTTLQTPVLEGRMFTDADRAGAPRAYVISESLARVLSPGRSLVGQRIVVEIGDGGEGVVVGVVGDIRSGGPTDETRPAVYLARTEWCCEAMDIVLRTPLPLERQATAIRSAVRSVDPSVVIHEMETMRAIAARMLALDRVSMLILLQFAVVALLLAGTGIYGVLAIEVGRRSRELGIRMAIGARPGQVRRMVLRRALITATVGVALGTALGLAATRGMQAMLHGISASDPRTFAGVALLMVVLALVAAYVPARRATRVDPVKALRE